MKFKTALIYAILTAAGFVLFAVAHRHATEERGYIAYGGEVFILLMPVYARTIRSCVKDIKRHL